jgi:uncharacterized membrane protein
MQNPPPAPVGKSSTGLDENIAALLAYVFGWISGLIFFLIEKDSKLVRFHAMQSLLFNVGVGVLCFILWIIFFVIYFIANQVASAMGSVIGLLGMLLWLVLGVCILAAWILCLVRAYQGQYFKLPVIGNLAEKFANKQS